VHCGTLAQATCLLSLSTDDRNDCPGHHQATSKTEQTVGCHSTIDRSRQSGNQDGNQEDREYRPVERRPHFLDFCQSGVIPNTRAAENLDFRPAVDLDSMTVAQARAKAWAQVRVD